MMQMTKRILRRASLFTDSKIKIVMNLERLTQRVRRRVNASIANLETLAELEVVPPYNVTLNNQEFLLFDSGTADLQRILIFSTQQNLQHLVQ